MQCIILCLVNMGYQAGRAAATGLREGSNLLAALQRCISPLQAIACYHP